MEKSIQNLIRKLKASDRMSTFNYVSIKGGSSMRDKGPLPAPENGNCTNTTADCKKSTNTDSCTNSYDCSDSTNKAMSCSNFNTCMA